MPAFIPGKQLCASYFFEIAKPILDESFPELHYTAGLLGYGSDVLGYDDAVSCDHMWGPRFYLFLRQEEKALEPEIRRVFAARLPYTYQGYSVNFSAPDPEDHGVRHPVLIDHGEVNPLLFIQTVPEYLQERLGLSDLNRLTAADWLSFSEHRLLSLASAQFYVDRLAEAAVEALRGTELEGVPLMGSLSQIGGLSTVSDDVSCRNRVRCFYEKN